jgi:hypothetical protein
MISLPSIKDPDGDLFFGDIDPKDCSFAKYSSGSLILFPISD